MQNVCIRQVYFWLMKKNFFLLNTSRTNIAAAIIICLFVALPDISWLYQNQSNSETDNFRGNEPGMSTKFPPSRVRDRNADFDPFDMPAPRKMNRERNLESISVDFCLFLTMTLLLLFVNAYFLKQYRNSGEYRVSFLSIINMLICSLFFIIYSFVFEQHGPFRFNGMVAFKFLFITVVCFLFAYVLHLINREHGVVLENEVLKSQNLQARNDALVAQINPHFLFNSLNALTFLIRQDHKEKALTYTNELSDIFRYVLSANKQNIATLEDEVHFIKSYIYLLKIRYENKLLFEMDIAPRYFTYSLPILSLQLLIENVIKHNSISSEAPLEVKIFTTDEELLVVSNPVKPKMRKEQSSGIGLQNLRDRYELLFSKEIILACSHNMFVVKLPLTKNDSTDY